MSARSNPTGATEAPVTPTTTGPDLGRVVKRTDPKAVAAVFGSVLRPESMDKLAKAAKLASTKAADDVERGGTWAERESAKEKVALAHTLALTFAAFKATPDERVDL